MEVVLVPGRTEPEGKVYCPYCVPTTSQDVKQFKRHQRIQHPDRTPLRYFSPLVREYNPRDELLRSQLEQLGHPGGNVGARDGYLQCYNLEENISNYVYEFLNPECAESFPTRKGHGQQQMLADRLLPLTCCVTTEDWKGGPRPEGYQVGHLAAHANHQHDEREKNDARLTSNLCFQHIKLNTGPAFKKVEELTRQMSTLVPTHCFTGTIVGRDTPRYLPNNSVPLPSHLYKLLVAEITETLYYCEPYLFPNDATCTGDRDQYLCTLDVLNERSGFNFLHNVRDHCHFKTENQDFGRFLREQMANKNLEIEALRRELQAARQARE